IRQRPVCPEHSDVLGPRASGWQTCPRCSAMRAGVAARPGAGLVPGWYGGGERVVELCSGTAVWRHAGLPVVPIRWVLVRDPPGRFDPQALLCTDPNQDPHQVLRWFVQRWQVETTFQETRAHLGVETQRQWSDRPSHAPPLAGSGYSPW